MEVSGQIDLPARLRERLAGPLPGRRGQARFAPALAYGRHYGPAEPNARPAAVLALFCRAADDWHLPLIVRSLGLPDHAGQVALPGGMVEPGESGAECALRETAEELGLDVSGVQLCGALSPLFVFVSNFMVTPYVGVVEAWPEFRPNPGEVAELLVAPWSRLRDPATYGAHVVRRRGVSFRVPNITCDGRLIWGATAMILGELLSLLADPS